MNLSESEKREYRRGYSKGYQHKINHRWPDEVPNPPDAVICELVLALKKLRDAYDGVCATFGDDDEIVIKLEPAIEAADESLQKLQAYISESLQDALGGEKHSE